MALSADDFASGHAPQLRNVTSAAGNLETAEGRNQWAA